MIVVAVLKNSDLVRLWLGTTGCRMPSLCLGQEYTSTCTQEYAGICRVHKGIHRVRTSIIYTGTLIYTQEYLCTSILQSVISHLPSMHVRSWPSMLTVGRND